MVSPLWTAEIVWHDIALASAFWEDFSWSPGGFLHEFTVAPPLHSFVTLELIGRTCPGGSTFARGAVERGTAKSWSLHQPVALTGPDLVSEVMFSGCPLLSKFFGIISCLASQEVAFRCLDCVPWIRSATPFCVSQRELSAMNFWYVFSARVPLEAAKF